MRFIAAALSWEFFSYQIWTMTYMVAIANALPLLCIVALRRYNIDLDSKELAILPAAMTPFTIFVLGMAVAIGQGSINRLYLRPLTNLQLVNSFFFPGLIATAILLAGSITTWNLMFNLHWPIMGPILYGTAFWAAIFPSLRLPIKSPTRVFEAMIVSLLLGVWCMRSGFNGKPNTSILQNYIGPLDISIMIGVVVGSFVLCVKRIGADRCSRTDSSFLALLRRVSNTWDRARQVSTRQFTNKYQAHQWFDWRTFGLPIVAGLGMMLLLPVPILLAAVIFGIKPLSEALTTYRNLSLSFVAIQLCLTGLWGLLAPHLRLGTNDISEQSELAKENQLGSSLSMGSYRATLPMSDQSLATIMLRTILMVSVSLGLILGLAWLAQSAIALAFSAPIELPEPRKFNLAWLIFIGPIGSWTLMSLGCCLSLMTANNKRRSILAFLGFLGLLALVSWIHWLAATVVLVLVVMALFATLYLERPSLNLIVVNMALVGSTILLMHFAARENHHRSILLIYAGALGVAAGLPRALMPRAIAAYRRS
ncbi:MAG: hypothetical protein U0930_00990 [Pirellulales bacterium]